MQGPLNTAVACHLISDNRDVRERDNSGCLCACVHVFVHACVRAGVLACVHACMRAFLRTSLSACIHEEVCARVLCTTPHSNSVHNSSDPRMTHK